MTTDQEDKAAELAILKELISTSVFEVELELVCPLSDGFDDVAKMLS